jgi:TolB-like protein
MNRLFPLTLALITLAGCAPSKSLMNTTMSPDLTLPDRPRIAVLPIELAGYADEDLTVIRQNWRNMVESGFLENSFRVVDRDVVDNILKEQHFQRSGVVNTATSVEVGKILGINLVLMGTVRVLAADGSKFHVQLRIINVQSAELMATTFATGDPGIGYHASFELAKKLKAKFNTAPKVP